MDFLCGQRHFCTRDWCQTSYQMSINVIRRLQSGRSTSRPGPFLLEIAAALLSVLALRDAILHDTLPSLEASSAAVLWIAYFGAAYCLAHQRVSQKAEPPDIKEL
jgi:hypothetical protein